MPVTPNVDVVPLPQSLPITNKDEPPIIFPKKSSSPKIGRKCKLCAIFSFSLFLICTITVFVGAAVEGENVADAASTIDYYSMDTVCAKAASSSSTNPISFSTFSNASSAHKDNSKVAHCGDCGECSNFPDINIYNITKNTLTKTTTNCATKAFMGGRETVTRCMDENVGLSPGCNKCWVDNVMCDMNQCVFTCIKSLILGGGKQQGGNNKGGGKLNDCLLCDEKLCGPAFIECSGANRRRSGIVSDIGRDEASEVCNLVDSGWWRNDV